MPDSIFPPPMPLPDPPDDTFEQAAPTPPHDAEQRDRFSEDDAGALIGVSFDDVMKAKEFLLALNRLSASSEINLRDAVIVVKDQDGKVQVRETIDPQPGRSALSAAMWSGLLGLVLGGPVGWLAGLGIGAGAGAITARIVDLGIPDEWVNWFKEAVRPHTATVVVLAGEINIAALHAEARRFTGAELVHTTLKPGVEEALAHAFDIANTTRSGLP
jgi:uncharacterized membrane protein